MVINQDEMKLKNLPKIERPREEPLRGGFLIGPSLSTLCDIWLIFRA